MDKSRKDLATIDQYIKLFSPDIQIVLKKMRKVISESAPGAEEAIRYQMPTFRLNNKNLVHFAAFKSHIGFYPVPSGIEAFKKELAPYITGKGTIQFQLDKPIPFDLVEKVVKFRVKETLSGKNDYR